MNRPGPASGQSAREHTPYCRWGAICAGAIGSAGEAGVRSREQRLSTADLKKRGLRSPDLADAFLTFSCVTDANNDTASRNGAIAQPGLCKAANLQLRYSPPIITRLEFPQPSLNVCEQVGRVAVRASQWSYPSRQGSEGLGIQIDTGIHLAVRYWAVKFQQCHPYATPKALGSASWGFQICDRAGSVCSKICVSRDPKFKSPSPRHR
jgi:hypothetical protein